MTETPDIVERRYLLVKRDLYYAPNNKGYTGIKDKAGRYFASDALSDCGVTAIHEDDAPDFTKACYADLARDHLQEKVGSLRAERDELRAKLEAMKPGLLDDGMCDDHGAFWCFECANLTQIRSADDE